MSSIINKIEEKFSSSSGRDNEPTNMQNPTSDYSGNNRDTTNFSSVRTGDNTTSGSNYDQHSVSSKEGGPVYNGVDGYGSSHGTSTSQYSTRDGAPANDTDRRIPGSWDTTDRTTGTSGLTQEPFKSQQTTANAVTGNTDVRHAQTSGVTNAAGNSHVQSSTGTAANTGSVPGDRYGTGLSTSDDHYGRNAGIVGGTGAAGLGAYEADKYSGRWPNTHHESFGANGTSPDQNRGHGTGSNLSNVSYMNRDNINNQHHSNSKPFSDEFSGRRGVGAMDPNPHSISDRALARKMGAAYEAGYRDALEHLRAEYHQQQQDSHERHGYGTNGPAYNAVGNSAYSSTNNGANEKPSITEKLNPKKDADKDGKAGIMD